MLKHCLRLLPQELLEDKMVHDHRSLIQSERVQEEEMGIMAMSPPPPEEKEDENQLCNRILSPKSTVSFQENSEGRV